MSSCLYDLTGDASRFPALGGDEAPVGTGADQLAHGSSASLTTQLVEEMVAAWRHGERPAAESFLARHPNFGTESALRLIHEEVCLRHEVGLEVVAADVVNRFPQWRAELELLLDCQRLMQGRRSSAVFPEVGELLSGFELVAELGRGASGRVFLALQNSLASRPVILKVTACVQEEHLALARLQHMNIVPLYSEEVLPSRDQRMLCMPYLGGATLARLLELLRDRPASTRSGKHLIDALDQAQLALPVQFPSQGPYRGTLARAPYVQAIAWIGACLADGVQYAHDRGLVHMDIKPSNVLLTGDGQPMLLDFHLARSAIDPGRPFPPGLGGTTAYASPEQKEAMAAIRHGAPIRVPVDGRSDIYSLGVLLYEALGGTVAGRGTSVAAPPLHRLNPEVSVGLSDIIHKCVCADICGRYPNAAALAGDLRRHLNHLPLAGVPNRSVLERIRKWRKRRPAALARQVFLLLSVVATIAAAVMLAGAYRERARELDETLTRSRADLAAGQFLQAENTLKHGLAVAGSSRAFVTWRRMYEDELRVALRNRKAAELHQLADIVRFRDGLAPQPSDDANALLKRGRELWHAHSLLLTSIPDRREPEIEQRIRTDLLDIVTVWAELRVQLSPDVDVAEARREALAQLDRAAALLGPGPALERLRRDYAKALGQPAPAEYTASRPLEPRTAWEHCDLGRAFLRDREFARAALYFQHAVDLRPQDFWPNFYQGLCAYRLGSFEDAVNAFRVCIALADHRAECYFNRALAYEALGRVDDALRDYTHALECDDRLTGAALNRGLLQYAAGHYADAAVDLSRALATATERNVRAVIHFNRALVHLARDDHRAALTDLKVAVDGGHTQARDLYKRLTTPGDRSEEKSESR